MSNVEKLKDYLVGKNGYLLNDVSNGKVIMLSGEWGSGKTHFWNTSEESITSKLDDKNKAHIYISLYGKTSLQEIENEVFTKVYYKSKGRDNTKKDVIEKLSSTFSILSSYIDDVSPVKVTPVIDFLEELKNDSQDKTAKQFIETGLIITFDDFERKSTQVNLNDLFGFITNLALQYKATIVIILNDDVFEEKEKEIFINVKEKTVSKYLKFTPTCKELFEIIIDEKNNKYQALKDDENIYRTLQNTFKEVNIVNARIVIQVLDNLLEWKKQEQSCMPFFIRYFVLSNINFILNHHVFEAYSGFPENRTNSIYILLSDNQQIQIPSLIQSTIKSEISCSMLLPEINRENVYSDQFIDKLKYTIQVREKENGTKSGKADKSDVLLEFIDKNKNLIQSVHFLLSFKLHVYETSDIQADINILNKINNFLETGIL